MTAERISSSQKELKFGGERKAESILKGFAITTLRNPRPAYDFSQGQEILADCFDDQQKVPIIVVSNEIRPIKKFSIPQLALDGFFNPQQVVQDMKTYPGYENLNTESPLQAITFISTKSYEALSKELQDFFYGEPFEQMIKMPQLRHLFFPTMCYWITERGGGLDKWIEFLKDYSLINPVEKKAMDHHDLCKGITAARLLRTYPSILQKVSQNPADKAFKPLVLGIFEN